MGVFADRHTVFLSWIQLYWLMSQKGADALLRPVKLPGVVVPFHDGKAFGGYMEHQLSKPLGLEQITRS